MFPLNAILKNDMHENTLICLLGRDEITISALFSCYYDGKLLLKSTPTLQWWAAICVHNSWFSTVEGMCFLNAGVELLLAFQEFHFLAKACNVRYYSPMATPYNATPSKIIQYISWIFGSSMLQEFCS